MFYKKKKFKSIYQNDTHKGHIFELIKCKDEINMTCIHICLFWETGGLWWQDLNGKVINITRIAWTYHKHVEPII